MQQEFITTKGKVVIERDVLFIRSFNHTPGRDFLYKLLFPLLVILMFIMLLFDDTKGSVKYFRNIGWGLFTLIQLPPLYEAIFKISYSNRIPLDRIRSVEIKPSSKLETPVILKLVSGRSRTVSSRTMEKQYEPFAAVINQYVSKLQTA